MVQIIRILSAIPLLHGLAMLLCITSENVEREVTAERKHRRMSLRVHGSFRDQRGRMLVPHWEGSQLYPGVAG